MSWPLNDSRGTRFLSGPCLDVDQRIICLEEEVLTPALHRTIPKSASGKILRRVLRDQAMEKKDTKFKDDVKEKAKL